MSDSPAPPIFEEPAQPRAQALTPETIENVLADFRGWLTALETAPAVSAAPVETLDLHTLLAQFTALRHEVNLQTKATRGQQEQNGATLQQLTQALEALEATRAAAEQNQRGQDEALVRPLLKTLIELHDALALAGREMTRVQETVLPLLAQLVQGLQNEPLPVELNLDVPPTPAPALWARWFGQPAPPYNLDALKQSVNEQLKQERDRRAERLRPLAENVERVRQLLGSLTTGYTMSLQRVERTLRQHEFEPIAAVGYPFDPELMEVVEAVVGTDRPNGEVLSEVRRGYLWNDRVFRFAQVRVAKS